MWFTFLLRWLCSLFKKLFRVDVPLSGFGVRYADYNRKTKTGKLRAKAGPIERQRRLRIDSEIFQVEGLSKNAKKVYTFLSAIADDRGYCFPFYKTIAKRTHLSVSTVSKALNELVHISAETRSFSPLPACG